MLRTRWRPVALILATALALACAATLLAPREYRASGGVLVPEGMLKVEYTAADPASAAARVARFIEKHRNALLVDPPLVVPVVPPLAQNLALGAAAVLLGAFFLLRRREPPALRSEAELADALGAPLIAARPFAPRELARQLAEQWFGRGRAVLPVVGADAGGGRTRVAAELARALAAMGVPTLLVDANLRSPGLHRLFGLRNRAGLADFLEDRKVRIAHLDEHLSVLVAGRSFTDPLELLSRRRMCALLAAAAKRYRAVIVDTPAAARGPDLQLFAAFAGGALVVVRRPAAPAGLKQLQAFLQTCSARVVGTVLGPA